MTFPECDVNPSAGYLWVHVSLLSLAAIIVIASFLSQLKDTAPYGRHAINNPTAKDWGFPIPQKIGHIISDALPGIPFFLFVYLIYAGLEPFKAFSQVDGVNIVLVVGWLAHYVYRGVIHPLITPYSARTVAVGITLAGIFPNCLFSYLVAAQIGCTKYPHHWARDPRFIIGVIVYCIGYLTNRWADLTLRRLRLEARRLHAAADPSADGKSSATASFSSSSASPKTPATFPSSAPTGPTTTVADSSDKETPFLDPNSKGAVDRSSSKEALTQSDAPAHATGDKQVRDLGYIFPNVGLFKLVTCPNYLGELVEWIGFALACWSYPALGWALFGASTFIPRALAHRQWYLEKFPEEMARCGKSRKALIPFIL